MYILYLLIIFCIIMTMLYFKPSSNTVITIFCSFLILFIIVSPELCINAAIDGAKLFFYSVFPSLFPFLVIINVIMLCDGINIYSKLFGKLLCKPLKLPSDCSIVLICSLLCGYPLGAKYTCELYSNKKINKATAQRLLSIATNASPLFVIGAVGTSMLHNTTIGYMLFLSNILSCLIIGFIYPCKETKIIRSDLSFVASNKNIGEIIKKSIEDALKTALTIGGFITIYSVLISIIRNSVLMNFLLKSNLPYQIKETLYSLIVGIVEMTNGTYAVSTGSHSTVLKIIIISFFISFSGFSIISQVYSFTYKYNFSIKTYINYKYLQGIISSVISLILYKLFILDSVDVIKMLPSSALLPKLYIVLMFILILPFVISLLLKKNKLFN